jgi:DnaJ-class molecular chaperone
MRIFIGLVTWGMVIKMKKVMPKSLIVLFIYQVQECWTCSGVGKVGLVLCKTCEGTKVYKEKQYYHIYTDESGKKYCLDGDSLK